MYSLIGATGIDKSRKQWEELANCLFHNIGISLKFFQNWLNVNNSWFIKNYITRECEFYVGHFSLVGNNSTQVNSGKSVAYL